MKMTLVALAIAAATATTASPPVSNHEVLQNYVNTVASAPAATEEVWVFQKKHIAAGDMLMDVGSYGHILMIADDHPVSYVSFDPLCICYVNNDFDKEHPVVTASSGLYHQSPYRESTKAAFGISISGKLMIGPADRTCVPCVPHLAHQALPWRTGFA